MRVVWTQNAQISFEAIVLYLDENFGKQVVQKFLSKTNSTIEAVRKFPNLYKATSLKQNLRKATISKVCSFYYEVHEDSIAILYFWDNRQEPIDY